MLDHVRPGAVSESPARGVVYRLSLRPGHRCGLQSSIDLSIRIIGAVTVLEGLGFQVQVGQGFDVTSSHSENSAIVSTVNI